MKYIINLYVTLGLVNNWEGPIKYRNIFVASSFIAVILTLINIVLILLLSYEIISRDYFRFSSWIVHATTFLVFICLWAVRKHSQKD